MRRSDERILTTHVGRLERPEPLTDAMGAHPRGRPEDPAFERLLRESVAEIVQRQADAGIDVVCDGEFGKISWNAYLRGRLAGFEDVQGGFTHSLWVGQDKRDFADYYAWRESAGVGALYYRSPGRSAPQACTGPVSYMGHAALQQDIDALLAALAPVEVEEAFMPSTAPGSIIWPNEHYPSDQEYLFALADALAVEYRMIVDAGLVLQLDDPNVPGMWDLMLPDADERAYREACDLRVAAANRALEGIPRDRVRYHICWGSWHGPHSTDVPLRMVMPALRQLEVGAFVTEGANARHEHEWEVWSELGPDDDRLVISGVVSHATDHVEHPELIAQRIERLASVVGRDRVMAGTDCGLGYRVHPDVGWAKLRALVEGADLASTRLW